MGYCPHLLFMLLPAPVVVLLLFLGGMDMAEQLGEDMVHQEAKASVVQGRSPLTHQCHPLDLVWALELGMVLEEVVLEGRVITLLDDRDDELREQRVVGEIVILRDGRQGRWNLISRSND